MTLLNQGPVMWRCTNGAPNYRTTWWARTYSYASPTPYSMPVHPVIVFTPWHRGCLSECNPLGQGSHSFNIGIEFWKWRWAVIIGRTDNVKTQVEIDRETEVKP